MAGRRRGKKGDAGSAVLLVGAVLLVVLAKYWVFVLCGTAFVLLLWIVSKAGGRTTNEPSRERNPDEASPTFTARIETSRRPSAQSTQQFTSKLKPSIPTIWVPPGKGVEVAGLSIPGGMIYVGSTLTAFGGNPEPAQIDPRLPIHPGPISLSDRLTGYWSQYHDISPDARRAYLTWLASGRSDPAANIGYVFLFYYGLERRVLIDAATDMAARAEIPLITREIRRLLSTYGNGSFHNYAGQLVEFLEYNATASRLYLSAPSQQVQSNGLSTAMRIALGQLAIDAKPVPAPWALAWAKADSNIHLSTPANRCPEQFSALFQKIYVERFGEGLKLPINRTKLKLDYRPASAGLLSRTFALDLGGLPDLTAVVAPAKKLQAIVDEATEALSAHSRFIGRNPEKAQSLESILLLPPDLWPAQAKAAFAAFDQRIGTGMILVKLRELASALGGANSLTREKVKTLVQALGTLHVGVEPDVLAGAKTPKADDSVVLFRLDPAESGKISAANYDLAAIMLDLATTVANADGKVAPPEIQFLNRQIGAWSHLGPAALRRLRARLRLLIAEPPTLASLKKRIEPLPTDTKGILAKLVSTLALADGVVTPGEVKLLEKIYKALGIDVEKVYSDLHVASANAEGAAPAPSPRPVQSITKAAGGPAGFTLDSARIAALQGETERVSELLLNVFAEEPPPAEAAVTASEDVVPEAESDHVEDGSAGLLGLDVEHSAFLRLLLSRPSWSRQELSDAAADMELMLDGALERINEAALDKYEIPLAEGDDPIEIAQDLKEKMAA